jgi:hypothetical protein
MYERLLGIVPSPVSSEITVNVSTKNISSVHLNTLELNEHPHSQTPSSYFILTSCNKLSFSEIRFFFATHSFYWRNSWSYDALAQVIFVLRAYLIVIFDDMPAIEMVMRIKGHNRPFPCRMCSIKGVRVRGTKGPTLYVPLDHSRHPYAHSPSEVKNMTR